jgi:hypothetical protein
MKAHLLTACFVALAACGGSKPAPVEPEPGPAPAPDASTQAAAPTYEYPPEFHDAFVEACMQGEDTRAHCECVHAKLTSRYSYDDVANDVVTDAQAAAIRDECAAEVPRSR